MDCVLVVRCILGVSENVHRVPKWQTPQYHLLESISVALGRFSTHDHSPALMRSLDGCQINVIF